MSEMKETLLPTVKGTISKVTQEKSFKSSDGVEWHGIEVSFANGDVVKVWNTSLTVLEQFQEGREITYTKKIVEKNGKQGFKLADYSFPVPRKDRFEPLVVPKLSDAVTYAASYAKDMCVAEESMDNFDNYADKMYEWMRYRLLQETFE